MSNKENQNKTRKMAGLLIVVVLVVISAVFIVVQRREGDEFTTDNMYRARQMIEFLSDSRHDNGVHVSDLRCDENDRCVLGEKSRFGIYAIWAEAMYYIKERDEEVLSLMEEDLDTYLDDEKFPDLQPHYWHCAMMYDIVQSDVFSDEIKDKAKALCEKAGAQVVSDTAITVSSVEVPSLKTDYPYDERVPSGSNWGIEHDASRASDHVVLYLAEEKDEDYHLAIQRAHDAFTALEKDISDGNLVPPETACIVSDAAVKLYNLTGDNKWLQFAQDVLEISKEWPLSDTSTAICAYAVSTLEAEGVDVATYELEELLAWTPRGSSAYGYLLKSPFESQWDVYNVLENSILAGVYAREGE